MTYKLLRVFSYDSHKEYENEIESRKNNPLAVTLPFSINPYQREQKLYTINYQLFYLPVTDLSFLRETLYENSKKIVNLLQSIPQIARNQAFTNNLIEEIKATNDIEGVRSTRKEISDAIEEVKNNTTSGKRFHGIVKLYLKFQDSEYSKITDVSDIRDIYDTLLIDEIEKKDIPDGKMFRKEKVFVSKNGKNVHEGVGQGNNVENDIIAALTNLVEFMNNYDVPALEKCLISHYYLEYVHPFYDGNGRLGRFIACSYLSRRLDPLSAISFSSAIKKQKGVYGTAFSEVSNPRNHGELTSFLIEMFDLLKKGQENIIDNLSIGKNSLDTIEEYLTTLGLNELQYLILSILAQDYLFSSKENLLKDMDFVDILKENYNYSRRKIDSALSSLRKSDYIIRVKQKPSSHILSEAFLTKINILTQ